MKFSCPDYDASIGECDKQALKEIFEELLPFLKCGGYEQEYRTRFANCFDGKIPAQEPVWLIRGQTEIGHAAVRAWAHLHRLSGGSDPLYSAAMKHAAAMEAWAKEHGNAGDGPK